MSSFGFHNVAPMGREARRITADRDMREKDRLADRRAGYDLKPTEICAMEDLVPKSSLPFQPGSTSSSFSPSTGFGQSSSGMETSGSGIATGGNTNITSAMPNRPRGGAFVASHPMSPNQDSAGWMADEERFHLDVAGELKQYHDIRKHSTQAKFDGRRKERIEAEVSRWESLYASEKADEDRTAALAGSSKRGNSSVAYNIVDGRWKTGTEAERLKYKDSLEEWRAQNRSNVLFNKGNNKDKINVLTGQPLPNYAVVPPRPEPPMSMLGSSISTPSAH